MKLYVRCPYCGSYPLEELDKSFYICTECNEFEVAIGIVEVLKEKDAWIEFNPSYRKRCFKEIYHSWEGCYSFVNSRKNIHWKNPNLKRRNRK